MFSKCLWHNESAFPQNASTNDVRTALTKISGGDGNTYEDVGNGVIVQVARFAIVVTNETTAKIRIFGGRIPDNL